MKRLWGRSTWHTSALIPVQRLLFEISLDSLLTIDIVAYFLTCFKDLRIDNDRIGWATTSALGITFDSVSACFAARVVGPRCPTPLLFPSPSTQDHQHMIHLNIPDAQERSWSQSQEPSMYTSSQDSSRPRPRTSEMADWFVWEEGLLIASISAP